jgi:hypothetical protein
MLEKTEGAIKNVQSKIHKTNTSNAKKHNTENYEKPGGEPMCSGRASGHMAVYGPVRHQKNIIWTSEASVHIIFFW